MNPYPDANGERTCIVTNREIPTAAAPDPEAGGGSAFKTLFDFFCGQESVTPVLGAAQIAIPPQIAAATATALASLAPLGAVPVIGPGLVAFASSAVVTAATSALVAFQEAIIVLLAMSPGGSFTEQLANVCNLASAASFKQLVPQLTSALIPSFRDPTAPPLTRESFRILTGQIACTADPQPNDRPPDPECPKGIDGFEFAFDVSPGKNGLFAFIDDFLSLVGRLFQEGTPVAAILSMRFTGKTNAILGMQQFARTCSVEIGAVRGFAALPEFTRRLHQIAAEHDALPHWGQLHEISEGQVRGLYPELSTWRQSLQTIVAGGGSTASAATFRSAFSVIRGLEPEAVQPPRVVDINEQTGEAFPYEIGTLWLHDRRSVTLHFRNAGPNTLRVFSVDVDGDFRSPDIPAEPLFGTPGRPHNMELEVTQESALPGEEIRVKVTSRRALSSRRAWVGRL